MSVSPTIKGRIHFDEKYEKVGTEKAYDLNAIDNKTKYVLAHLFVHKRSKRRCIEFLRQIKDTCYDQILSVYEQEKVKPKDKRKLITFVSDGFENCRSAFRKLFYRVAKLEHGVPIACIKYGLEHNNNPIERYNEDIKDRTKVMRNFKSFDKAEKFMNLRRIVHNFVNPHMSLDGKTPAEEADIDLKLGRRKMLKMIKNMAKITHHSLR